MLLKIEEIIVNERIRHQSSDIAPLVESIRKVGVMQPILVTHENVLLSGYRRLEACRQLKMTDIPVIVVKVDDDLQQLELEYHENIGRVDLSADEHDDYLNKRTELLTPLPKSFFLIRWFRRILNFFSKLFRKNDKTPAELEVVEEENPISGE